MASSESHSLPVVIVGAGPAGLAAARALRRLDIPYRQFERHSDVGGIWDIDNPGTPMYRSAHFISSRDKSGFFDFPMPAHFADYPSRTQILEYTHDFTDEFGLREGITFSTSVSSATQNADETWTVVAGNETITASAVIACSGVTWDPSLPAVPGTFDGEIIHSVDYRDTSQFAGKRVLVVGLGNSGADIACDAASSAEQAYVSTRRGYHFIPKHILGEPSDNTEWLPIWGERLLYNVMKPLVIGDVRRWGLPKPDHKLFETHPLLNTQLLHYLQHGDITAKPGIERFDGPAVVFTDGTRIEVDLVVFATGYRMSIPFLPEEYIAWNGTRPTLYLHAFSTTHRNLFGISYLEVNSSAYTLFDHIASLIAQYLDDERRRPEKAAEFRRFIATDDPDLSGGVRFVDSARHANYVEVRAFRRHIHRLIKRMGWVPLTTGMFDSLRREPVRRGA